MFASVILNASEGSSDWILRLRLRMTKKGALVTLFALCTLWPAQATAASELQKQMVRDMKKCGSTTEEVTCVVEGKDEWLFLQESLLNATKRWTDNTPQIIAFKDSLESRGIKLIVVPVPDKLQVVPEYYSDKAKKGINLPQYKKWVQKLRKKTSPSLTPSTSSRNFTKNKATKRPYSSRTRATAQAPPGSCSPKWQPIPSRRSSTA